ncbi:MAG: sigma 54-interacting transcriptional regulator [Myxococcaceae bacterium]|nr:sigma 54-interacting transcriptional regulator [Myxococcaceae bacterium]
MSTDDRKTIPHGSSQPAEGPRVRRFKLSVLDGDDAGKTYESREDACTIGQHELNQLRLADATVSRFHCEITMTPKGARIRDLESLNGIYVDGLQVNDGYLRGGSLIRLGRVTLRFDFSLESNRLEISENTRFGSLRGSSASMRSCFAMLERAAASDATVLLLGETGTGKSRAARSVHAASARRSRPFLTVDCGSLPANLLETELFGHERGAFSGAQQRRIGIFEEANGGTVFIDEIGELPLELQPKLLRALDAKEIRRVGSNQYVPVNVRLIAATHRDLRTEVNSGRFRPDLFFRLAVVCVMLPPLRAHAEDISFVVEGLLDELKAPPDVVQRVCTPEFVERLRQAAWPGNVRELRNYLERCLVFERELELSPADPTTDEGGELIIDASVPYADAKRKAIEAFERGYVQKLLELHNGNVTAAAQAAEIDRVSLHRIMRRSRRAAGSEG